MSGNAEDQKPPRPAGEKPTGLSPVAVVGYVAALLAVGGVMFFAGRLSPHKSLTPVTEQSDTPAPPRQ